MSDSDDKNRSDSNKSSEEEEERYIALPAVKCRGKNAVILKQRRQKFCLTWTRAFPWIKMDNVDESIGVCSACNKRLVCKKSHLERHERSCKHQRNMRFVDIVPDGMNNSKNSNRSKIKIPALSPMAPEFMECGKKELDDDQEYDELEIEQDSIGADDFSLSTEMVTRAIKTEDISMEIMKPTVELDKRRHQKSNLSRLKLLERIDRDRQELNECYYARQEHHLPATLKATSPLQDSFDLFFESVSASVKTLPPKLAAEVKIRVSQIVAECEMRAIYERENLDSTLSGNTSTMVVASTTSQGELPESILRKTFIECLN